MLPRQLFSVTLSQDGGAIQGRRGLEMFFNRASGLTGALPLAFCLPLVPSVSGAELRAGVPAVLSRLNLCKMAMAIGAQVDVF